MGLPVRAVTRLLDGDMESVSMDTASVTLVEGADWYLHAAMQPERAILNDQFEWISSDTRIATVDGMGTVTAVSAGSCDITAAYRTGGTVRKASCHVTVTGQKMNALDLGLSVLWSDVNAGAASPTDGGAYFGKDVEPLEEGGRSDGWRLPTSEEVIELLLSCNMKTDTIDGKRVMLFTTLLPGYSADTLCIPFAGMTDNHSISFYELTRKGPVNLNITAAYLTSDSEYPFDLYSRSGDSWSREMYHFPARLVRALPESDREGRMFIISESDANTLGLGESLILTGVYQPGNLRTGMEWKSSDPKVATVADGRVTALKKGKCVITATLRGASASFPITVADERFSYVDLGLSVKWAAVNMGASVPEYKGSRFNWGEVGRFKSAKREWYRFYDGSNGEYGMGGVNKYAASSQTNGNFHDDMTVLEPEDDAATWNMGDNWRMPSKEELQELIDECDWTQETLNGQDGWRITSRKEGFTDRSIFLPVGQYYSNALYAEYKYHCWYVYGLNLDYYRAKRDEGIKLYDISRTGGCFIRPVKAAK